MCHVRLIAAARSPATVDTLEVHAIDGLDTTPCVALTGVATSRVESSASMNRGGVPMTITGDTATPSSSGVPVESASAEEAAIAPRRLARPRAGSKKQRFGRGDTQRSLAGTRELSRTAPKEYRALRKSTIRFHFSSFPVRWGAGARRSYRM